MRKQNTDIWYIFQLQNFRKRVCISIYIYVCIFRFLSKFYSDNKMKRTGIAGIFAASLELTKEGIVSISQEKKFEKVMIKKT